jgi:hypothetical protein
MATAALLAIGKAAAVPLLNKLKDDIMGNKYGDASAAVEAILAAQSASFARLEHKIELVVTQQALDEQFVLIKTWTVALQEGLLKKKNGQATIRTYLWVLWLTSRNRAEDALKPIYKAFKGTSDGVLHSLTTIDALLCGDASGYSNAAAIDLYQDKIYHDLESGNMNFTIATYLQSVCDHLEAHFILQGTGLMLRIAAADGKPLPK